MCILKIKKNVNQNDFDQTILSQCIWGNMFITNNVKNEKVTMCFKRWIDSGLLTIGQLRFTNGLLDEQYIYRKVLNKQNIISEVARLKKALKLYANILGNHEPLDDFMPELVYQVGEHFIPLDEVCTFRSKSFYINLRTKKQEIPQCHKVLNSELNEDINFNDVFTKQIKDIKNKKLAETNFKLLHNILPCNKNLKRWRKKDSDLCDICLLPENCSHLVFNCEYARIIWNFVREKTGYDFTYKDIIIGKGQCKAINEFKSLVCYIIYNDWLKSSLKNQDRKKENALIKFNKEIQYWCTLYGALKMEELTEILRNFT